MKISTSSAGTQTQTAVCSYDSNESCRRFRGDACKHELCKSTSLINDKSPWGRRGNAKER